MGGKNCTTPTIRGCAIGCAMHDLTKNCTTYAQPQKQHFIGVIAQLHNLHDLSIINTNYIYLYRVVGDVRICL
jgi:hypothetical protein